jgi:diguanylate cyclase (GGDEF)-like protein/PAS domain S-box-containing protein
MSAAGAEDGWPLEDSFEDLYQRAPCGYLSTTPGGVIVTVNDTFLGWTGYSRDQLLGTAFVELLDGGGRLFYETRHLPVLQLQGEVREVALALRCADGSTLSVLVNSELLADDEGSPRVIRTAVFDATARQDYEHQLLVARRDAEQSSARVRILQDASAAFAAVETETAFDDALIASFQGAFDASDVVLLDADENGTLRLKSGATPLDVYLGDEPDRRIAAAAMAGELVTISTPDEAEGRFPVTAAAMRAARYDALTATPLMHDGVVFGVVACLFRRGRAFDDHTRGIHAALARQAAQVLARIRLQRELEQLALHDQLTKLANRTLIENTIQFALDRAATKRRPIALIFVDLDGFKTINDKLGHMAGDAVLQEVAARLRGAVRHDDIVGRLGGDEFLVVCDEADEQAVGAIAERIRVSVRRPLAGVAAGFMVSASVGVAVHTSSEALAVTAAQMIGFADSAMYTSKQAGKDRVTLVSV